MAETGFTPGPWLIHTRHRWVVPAVDAFKEPAEALPICSLRDPDERLTEDETLDNGFLIAAAPELYEALDTLLNTLDHEAVGRLGIEQETLAANCALAKARGQV